MIEEIVSGTIRFRIGVCWRNRVSPGAQMLSYVIFRKPLPIAVLALFDVVLFRHFQETSLLIVSPIPLTLPFILAVLLAGEFAPVVSRSTSL
jgi:hypothetical protein